MNIERLKVRVGAGHGEGDEQGKESVNTPVSHFPETLYEPEVNKVQSKT